MSTGFIDPSIDGFNHQQINLCSKIGNYTFDKVSAGEITAVKADATYLTWEITTRKAYISNGESWTNFEIELYNGFNLGLPAVQPAVPTISIAPLSV